MSPVKLFYLPLCARAESTRLILKYGNVPFEDVVLSFHDWGEAKAKGEICHFGQLPSMQMASGKILSQSGATGASQMGQVHASSHITGTLSLLSPDTSGFLPALQSGMQHAWRRFTLKAPRPVPKQT